MPIYSTHESDIEVDLSKPGVTAMNAGPRADAAKYEFTPDPINGVSNAGPALELSKTYSATELIKGRVTCIRAIVTLCTILLIVLLALVILEYLEVKSIKQLLSKSSIPTTIS